MRPYRLTALLALAGALFSTAPARADVSSWYSLAPGASFIRQDNNWVTTPVLDADAGLGTHPAKPIVVGALVRFAAQFDVGADVGGAFRICSGSYARGDWGVGLDLGSHYRFATFGGAAATARVFVGGPWGLVLHLGGSYGEGNVRSLGASLGLDFARLTAHRSYFTETLPSPLSSPDQPVQPMEPAASSLAPRIGF